MFALIGCVFCCFSCVAFRFVACWFAMFVLWCFVLFCCVIVGLFVLFCFVGRVLVLVGLPGFVWSCMVLYGFESCLLVLSRFRFVSVCPVVFGFVCLFGCLFGLFCLLCLWCLFCLFCLFCLLCGCAPPFCLCARLPGLFCVVCFVRLGVVSVSWFCFVWCAWLPLCARVCL